MRTNSFIHLDSPRCGEVNASYDEHVADHLCKVSSPVDFPLSIGRPTGYIQGEISYAARGNSYQGDIIT